METNLGPNETGQTPSATPAGDGRTSPTDAQARLNEALHLIEKQMVYYGSDEEVKDLKYRLDAYLRKIRETLAYDSSPYVQRLLPGRKQPDKGFRLPIPNSYSDHVLHYVLAHRIGDPADQHRYRQQALAGYCEMPEAYDCFFGNLIPEELLNAARQRIAVQAYNACHYVTADQDWAVYRRGLDRRRSNLSPRLATGLTKLDHALGGGLHGLTFLAGPPGVGKTTLALEFAVRALRHDPDLAVLFYTLEASKTLVLDRLFCAESGLGYHQVTGGCPTGAMARQLQEAEARLQADVLPRLRLVDRGGLPQDDVLSAAALSDHRDDLVRATGAKQVLVVLDYFQVLKPAGEFSSPLEGDQEKVHLLQEAREPTRTACSPCGDPYLVISEVRKAESGREGLDLDDLLGSARLGYAADTVLLLEPQAAEQGGDTAPLALKIAKGRDGVKRETLDLVFDHPHYRFFEAGEVAAKGKSVRRRGLPAAKEPSSPGPDPLAGGRKD